MSNAIHNAADLGLNLTIYLVKHIEHNDAFCHILQVGVCKDAKIEEPFLEDCNQIFGSYVDNWQTSQVRDENGELRVGSQHVLGAVLAQHCRTALGVHEQLSHIPEK